MPSNAGKPYASAMRAQPESQPTPAASQDAVLAALQEMERRRVAEARIQLVVVSFASFLILRKLQKIQNSLGNVR